MEYISKNMGMRANLICLFIALLSGTFGIYAQQTPRPHVLLIGVGKYPPTSGWPELSSEHDLDLLSSTFIRLGFDSASIHRMTDQEVTRASILQAIRQYLTEACKPGDMAIFHFSGHGQQIPDDNGDEPDGFDEALVPYDSPKNYQTGVNEGQYLLRDDELATALRSVRERLGPKGQLFVSMDACHSGSASRGRVSARGTDIIMAPTGMQQRREQSELEIISSDRELSFDQEGLAPAIYFYSSSPRQLSYEIDEDNRQYGLFTYALCRSLNRGGADCYMDLWNDLKQFVQAKNTMQTPFAEGALRSRIFMNQGLHTSVNSFNVLQIHSNRSLKMEGGRLEGITEGSEVKIIQYDNKAVLAKGTIEQSGAFDSEIKLKNATELPPKESLRVSIDKVNYSAEGCSIQLICDDRYLEKKLIHNLRKFALINNITRKTSDYIFTIRSINTDSITYLLQTREGAIISVGRATKKDNPDLWLQQFRNDLTHYIKARRLVELETMDDILSARVFLTLCDGTARAAEDSVPVLKNGQRVCIAISNTGKESFYFSVFHIGSDNKITRVVPFGEQNPAEFSLDPGKTKIIFANPEFIIEEPFGTDVLKVICTHQPVHFGATRGIMSRPNPMKDLLKLLSSEEQFTRGTPASISSEQGFIGTYIFRTCK